MKNQNENWKIIQEQIEAKKNFYLIEIVQNVVLKLASELQV